MADMKLFIELLARSTGLKRELQESEKGFRNFGSVAKREMDKIRQVSGTLQGQLAGLGLSIGVLQQLRMSAHLDKGLTQIKQTAGETGDVVKDLRKEFFAMSRETGRDVEGLKSGFDSLIQSGQNWKAALNSTRGLNIATAVTNANEKTLAGGLTVGARAFNLDLEKPGMALALLDKMTVAGRLGQAEVEKLADIFARVGVNAASANMNFDGTLAFIEALSLGEQNPERLATLVDSTLRVFTNLRYMSEAQKGTGVKFFDAKGARRDTTAVFKDIKSKWDILKTDQDRAVFIQKAFGKADLDTIKGVRTLLQGDSLNKLESFLPLIANAGGTLEKNLPEAIDNAADAAGRLKAVFRLVGDELAQPVNKAITALIGLGINSNSKGGLDLSGKQIIGGTVAFVGGTYLAAKLGNNALKGVASRLLAKGGSTALGVTEGKALEAAAGITPVFVTNWPGNILPPVQGNPKLFGQGTAGKAFGWGVNAAALIGPYALPAALAGSTFIPKMISDKQRESGWGSQTIGHGSKEYEVMGIGGRRGGTHNEITIDLQIDAGGRIFARSNDLNTSATIGGKRGSLFDTLLSTESM